MNNNYYLDSNLYTEDTVINRVNSVKIYFLKSFSMFNKKVLQKEFWKSINQPLSFDNDKHSIQKDFCVVRILWLMYRTENFPNCSYISTIERLKHLEKKLGMNYPRMMFWINPGSSTRQNNNSMTIYFQSCKPSKQDILGTAGEAKKDSWVVFSYRLLYWDTPVLSNQQNLHSPVLCGH